MAAGASSIDAARSTVLSAEGAFPFESGMVVSNVHHIMNELFS